ncbi:MAG TPA: GNAT family N-acetyltransferase [Thermotogota bacterium]|nr:GNAT family N-acetyltransferase [Thermotogota bacterium]HRW34441.1 GNAT family N-acetyltransferase [Thermotogota bacterium]
MNIRVLNESDTQAYRTIRLNALINNPEAFGSSYEEESAFEIARFTHRLTNPRSQTYGAFEGERLGGICNISFQPRKKMRHRADIFSMYVEPAFRGKGVGRQLIETVLMAARMRPHVRQVYLTVVSSNQTAKVLYTSFGFKTYGVDQMAMFHNDRFFDHDLMVLYLKQSE